MPKRERSGHSFHHTSSLYLRGSLRSCGIRGMVPLILGHERISSFHPIPSNELTHLPTFAERRVAAPTRPPSYLPKKGHLQRVDWRTPVPPQVLLLDDQSADLVHACSDWRGGDRRRTDHPGLSERHWAARPTDAAPPRAFEDPSAEASIESDPSDSDSARSRLGSHTSRRNTSNTKPQFSRCFILPSTVLCRDPPPGAKVPRIPAIVAGNLPPGSFFVFTKRRGLGQWTFPSPHQKKDRPRSYCPASELTHCLVVLFGVV